MGDYDEFVLLCISFIGSATLITTIFKNLKLPTQVGLILSGILAGPYGFKIIKDLPATEFISELAIILLMFCLGLEFSLSRLKRLGRYFLLLGPLQVVCTTIVVSLVCYFVLHQAPVNSILWGFLVSFSSTALVLRLLQSSKRDKSSYGDSAIGILLFQDLAVILVMLWVSFIDPNGRIGVSSINYWSLLTSFATLVVATYLLARYIVPFVIKKVAMIHSRELFFYSIFLACFGIAYFTHYFGLSYPIGAFVAGLILSGSPYGKHALAEFKLLRDNFLGIFFISIGLMIDPWLFLSNAPRVLIYTFLILVTKGMIIFAIMRLMRYPKRHALMVSLIMFQVGEFSFLLASITVSKGLLPIKDMQLFLTLSITTMIITCLIFKRLPSIAAWLMFDRRKKQHGISVEVDEEQAVPFQEEVLVVGLGHIGTEVCKKLHKLEVPFKVIEQNYNNFFKHKYDWPLVYGDATSRELLHDIGLTNLKLAVVSINNHDVIDLIVANLKSINPYVEILVRLTYVEDEHLYIKDDLVKHFVSEREVTKAVLDAVDEHFDIKS